MGDMLAAAVQPTHQGQAQGQQPGQQLSPTAPGGACRQRGACLTPQRTCRVLRAVCRSPRGISSVTIPTCKAGGGQRCLCMAGAADEQDGAQ